MSGSPAVCVYYQQIATGTLVIPNVTLDHVSDPDPTAKPVPARAGGSLFRTSPRPDPASTTP